MDNLHLNKFALHWCGISCLLVVSTLLFYNWQSVCTLLAMIDCLDWCVDPSLIAQTVTVHRGVLLAKFVVSSYKDTLQQPVLWPPPTHHTQFPKIWPLPEHKYPQSHRNVQYRWFMNPAWPLPLLAMSVVVHSVTQNVICLKVARVVRAEQVCCAREAGTVTSKTGTALRIHIPTREPAGMSLK